MHYDLEFEPIVPCESFHVFYLGINLPQSDCLHATPFAVCPSSLALLALPYKLRPSRYAVRAMPFALRPMR